MAEPKKEVSPKSTAIGCLVLFVVLVLAGWACSSILKDQPAPKTTTSGGLSIIWKESTPLSGLDTAMAGVSIHQERWTRWLKVSPLGVAGLWTDKQPGSTCTRFVPNPVWLAVAVSASALR